MRPKLLPICLLLTLFTICAYWSATDNPFVNYDDHYYVTQNPHVTDGLSWAAVQWAFTSFDVANWHPLTWISHQLDVTLFGLNPRGHHASNLLLHIANALLLLLLLVRLTGTLWRSVTVVAIFALHPLHVESVAWVAERKDLLCAFFFLLTLYAYLRYTKRSGWRTLLPVLLFFTLSLMSKPMSVTLPFVLLLLDWWPLNRFGSIPLRKIILEKIPFAILSFASSIVTLYAQKSGEAVITVEKLSILYRLMNALSAYLIYLRNMVWPQNLALLYPLPDTPPIGTAAVGAVLIVLLTLAFFYQRKNLPYLLTGWFWYLGMLVPVIGLVQVGIQSHADRYTYLPMIGCSIAVVWGLHDISAKWSQGHNTLRILAPFLMLVFIIQTRQQVLVWRNNETLFRHALAVTSNNYVIHMTLGSELWNQGRRNEAIAEYRKAIKITPQYPDHYFILATALLLEGKAEEAAKEYRKTLELRPDFPFAHTNLGMALQKMGRFEEAITEYKEGLRVVPDDYKAKDNLQLLLRRQSQ